MVGGSASQGRLEVSSTDGWLTNYGEVSVAWRPVCDGPEFDESLAQVMCKLMGFKYGRKYYTPAVSYRDASQAPPASTSTDPLGFIYCSAAYRHRHRRLLNTHQTSSAEPDASGGETASATTSHAGALATGFEEISERLRGHARSLQAPLRGSINTGVKAPYMCTFRAGECGFGGPLVGLKCSNSLMPPAPPPPPSPPVPPEAPQPPEPTVRLIGGNYMVSEVEPNLCNGSNFCNYFGRVELLVDLPGSHGTKTWAPLCANDLLSRLIGRLACKEVFTLLNPFPGEDFVTVPQLPTAGGFPIPTGSTFEHGDFDPTQHEAWASVVGGSYDILDSAKVVADLGIQVSSTPCQPAYLFALSCVIRMARH